MTQTFENKNMLLLQPYDFAGLRLKNRVVMSPMLVNLAAANGDVTDELVEYYASRARGGVGLIIVENTSVSEAYKVAERGVGIWDDSHITGLKKLVEAIKNAGSKACIQISHALRARNKKPVDLDETEIRQLVKEFSDGARRAAQAGFDAVEVHMAHSYTLCDFLSARGNERKDAYGGSLNGRLKICVEVVEGIRSTLGDSYPVLCRVSADEFIVGGNTLRHTVPAAKILEELGVAAIDVSAANRLEDGGRGSYSDVRGKPTREFPDGANVYLAEAIKREVKIPVITVGKLGDPMAAERVLQEKKADLIALGRPLLADPEWVNKVAEGRIKEIRKCACCNKCFDNVAVFQYVGPVRCETWAGQGRKRTVAP